MRGPGQTEQEKKGRETKTLIDRERERERGRKEGCEGGTERERERDI